MFYPQVQSVKFSSKMKMMQEDPRHKEVMEQMQKAAREGDRSAQQQAQFLSSVLRKEYDVPVTGLLWTFLPIPFSIGLFRILNGMASIPVPSLETAGWLWFQDLSAADPYYALPALATGIMLLTMKVCSRTGPHNPYDPV
jgi:YidC/Oxa1 family membrane protein insertase